MNSVCLAGRITEPEMKYSSGGMAIVTFAVAVDKWSKAKGKESQFFNCVFLGERAAKVYPHLEKGMPLAVEGSLNQNRWEKDGQKRERIEVFVNNITFMSPKSGKRERSFADDVPF